MSSLRLTRSTRLTALACSALTAACLVVACGNTDDVPGNDSDDGGASGSAGAHAGRAGASGGKAGAASHAGAGGAQSGAANGGTSGDNDGAGRGGTGTGGIGGAHAGAAGGGGTAAGGAGAGGSGGSAAASGGAAGSTAASGGAGAGGTPTASGGAGAGGGAGALISAGAGGTCGNGIKEAAEQCDDGAAGNTASTSAKCSNTCTSISTEACVACENTGDCGEYVDNCLGVAAPFDSTQQTQCYSVLTCIQKSNCFDGTGTLSTCYCGTLSTTDCSAAPFTGAGSPNGTCVAEIKAGFPTLTTNSQVIAGLVATNFPSGAAMKRLTCQKTANQSACLDICGFTAGGPAFP